MAWGPTKEEIALLKDIKAGDQVAIEIPHGRAPNEWIITKVDRVTPAQILVHHWHFWKKNGQEVGSGWHQRLCYPLTDERYAQVGEAAEKLKERQRKSALVRKLSDVRWRNLDVDTLEAVANLLGIDA